MATRFVNIDRETPMLLPPDLKEWVAENDLAKFVLEAVAVTETSGAAVSARRSHARQVLLAQRQKMRVRLAQPEAACLYARRQVWSEAPFHVIKNILGFGRFRLRGLSKVNLEWQLVALAYNCRKMVAARATLC